MTDEIFTGQHRVSGDTEWVKRKKTDVEIHFEKRGDQIRAFFDDYLPIAAALFLGVSGYLVLQSGFGGRFGLAEMGDVYQLAIVSFFVGMFSQNLLNRFYPYVLLSLDQNKRLNPYLRRVVSAIGLLAAIITINGWLLS